MYDMFMENIPYKKWSKRIIQILNGHGIYDGIVTDLGCGTGCLTQLLAEANSFDVKIAKPKNGTKGNIISLKSYLEIQKQILESAV